MKIGLLASAAILFAAPAAFAQAQEAPMPASATTDDSADARPGLDMIVITAEKREETVQRSSLSLEVFTSEELADVSKPSDLTSLSPGVQVGTSGPTPQVYVRGVGEPTANSRSQGAVAFNIDGVYIGRSTQVGPLMFDLSRLELLKGPQGTLYGRNASGGAINIITNGPELGELGGFVAGELSNFDGRVVQGALNIPLGETLAVRVAAQSVERDGYTSNGGQDQKMQAARFKLLWEPSEAVSLKVNADASHIGGEGSGVVLKDNPGDAWRDITDTPLPYPFLFSANTAPYSQPDDRFIDSDTWSANAELNADLGFATLTVIPAFRSQNQEYVSYTSNFRFFEGIDDTQQTFEARLGNDGDRLKWTGGYYYFKQEQDMLLSPFSSARLAAVTFDQTSEAHALFGQATIGLTDAFRLIAGGRYTEETIEGEYQQGVGGPPLVPFSGTGPVVPVGPLSFEKTNYKIGAEYDIAADSMLFATYSTGFKGGGFVQTLTCGADTFAPEEVKALTLGSRNRFAQNTVQLNAEVFHWEYIDQQIAFVGADSCGGTTFLTRNPGNATIQGANIDLTLAPTISDTLRFAVEYNDATYDSFRLRQFGTGAYAPAGGTLCTSSIVGSGPQFDIDCSGQRLSRTPEWSGTASYEHVFFFAGGAELAAKAEAQYASERWLDFNYLPNGRGDAYLVANAELTFRPADGDWSITGYINNIGDEVVYTGGASVPQLAPNGYRLYAANILAPQTFGVRMRYGF